MDSEKLNEVHRNFLSQLGKSSLDLTPLEESSAGFQSLLAAVLSYFNALARWSSLPAAAQDVVCQDALIKVWRAAHKYDTTKARFSTWCGLLFKQVASNYYREANSNKVIKTVSYDHPGIDHLI